MLLLLLLLPLLLHKLVVTNCCAHVADVQSLATNNSNNNNNNNNNKSTLLNFHESLTKRTAAVENIAAAATAAAAAGSTAKLRRGKRYLDFTRGTRISWRTNIKNNLIKINTLWAHAFGFRFNYPFPDKADRLRPFFKRDVLSVLEESISAHGFDGRACVLKSYCSAILDTKGQGLNGGLLFGLLKILFSLDSHDRRHLPHLRPSNCGQILHSHCPLSFNNISPFTDDV